MLNIEPRIEKDSLTFVEGNSINNLVYCKWSKLILIQVTLMLHVFRCLLLW